MKFRQSLTSKVFYSIASAIILTTALPSYAQDPGSPDPASPRHFGGDKRHGDWAGGMEKRLEKLKTELKIQPNQEGAWQAYATQTREQSKKMKAHHQEAGTAKNLTLPEQLDQRLSLMKQRQADMEETANALKTLYSALTPEQRAIMDKRFSERKRHRR